MICKACTQELQEFAFLGHEIWVADEGGALCPATQCYAWYRGIVMEPGVLNCFIQLPVPRHVPAQQSGRPE